MNDSRPLTSTELFYFRSGGKLDYIEDYYRMLDVSLENFLTEKGAPVLPNHPHRRFYERKKPLIELKMYLPQTSELSDTTCDRAEWECPSCNGTGRGTYIHSSTSTGPGHYERHNLGGVPEGDVSPFGTTGGWVEGETVYKSAHYLDCQTCDGKASLVVSNDELRKLNDYLLNFNSCVPEITRRIGSLNELIKQKNAEITQWNG